MTDTSVDDLDHPWDTHWDLNNGASTRTQTPANALGIETIGPVTALDAQFGVERPKTVPDVLADAMFGQTAEAPHFTYALFDAAKRTNFIEALEASGLERACLFKGEAFDTLKELAPWVVRLEEGNAFSRALFTQSDAPWHLWPAEPALYLRSSADLDSVVRHLRKFTKLQSKDGAWHFFRFWEPSYFHVLADRRDRFAHLEAIWSMIFQDSTLLVPRVATASMLRLDVPKKDGPYKASLTDEMRAELKLSVLYRNMIAAAEDLFEMHPDEVTRYGDAPVDLWPHLYDFVDEVRAVGLSDPELRGRMLLLAFLKYPQPWPAFLDLPFWQQIRQSPGQANDLFEDFCARLKHQAGHDGSTLEVWW